LNQEGLAVPATAFHATQGRALRIDVTESQLSGAPRISMDATEQMESVSFASDVYRHYNQQPWWGGGSSGNFGNVHSIRQLRDAKIENVQNTPIGDIEDVVLDLPAGRVLFVVVQADEQFNLGNQLTAIPPNMFTKSRKSGVLIADLDREKLANAPGFNQNRWPDLENYEFASRVYQHFGKTPYFKDSPLAPTGEEERENQRRNRRDRRD
jgi:sporulation protein YlmC with PRC-barrel domain